jgi:hypothetical protein
LKNSLCLLTLGSMILSCLFLPVPCDADYGMNQNLIFVDASFWGEHPEDWAASITKVGDVNGDGFDDILIGASRNDDKGSNAGKTYLVFGKASGWSIDTPLWKSDASFIGEKAEDGSGGGLGGADINNDGYQDILIGAGGNDEAASNAGKSYVFFGKPTGWKPNISLSTADASFLGEKSGDGAASIVSAGDVNGDGFDDILISAQGNDLGGVDAGKVYLIFGKASGWKTGISLSKADASFNGEAAGDNSGSVLASAGDVNGDGFDDILIGALNNDGGGDAAGKGYLILGKASGWHQNTSLSLADASFIGEHPGDWAGYSMAGAGDVNRDGLDDFLIGAYRNSDSGMWAGQTYLLLGKASGWLRDTSLAYCDGSWVGEGKTTYDESGASVAGAGDVNGDGYDDILIGAPSNQLIGKDAGQSYLILGKSSGWAMRTSLSYANSSWVGESPNNWAGAVSSAGDVNQDGLDEILIGAAINSEPGTQAGQTYLIFVDPFMPPSSVDSVKAYRDDSYSAETDSALINQSVYIQLWGVDGDPARQDITFVDVVSNLSDPKGIQLRLNETGPATGVYRGDFSIRDRTNGKSRWINASEGEMITISSVQDPSKKATILVNPLVMQPLQDNKWALENWAYRASYWTEGHVSVTWKFNTNASWLHWNATRNYMYGTPNNSNVGRSFVFISVTAPSGKSVIHNFTLTVNNTPPAISTKDVIYAITGSQYFSDYNSSDDGQGVITWHLKTNGSDWLKIDPKTGVLSGSPATDKIGLYYVNVSVDDGNGGWDWSNFTLSVMDLSHRLIITTKDPLFVMEDIDAWVKYKAVDLDNPTPHLTWSLNTNASFLTLDRTSGDFRFKPREKDIGRYWVNVSVINEKGDSDFHNFTMTVQDYPDAPRIEPEDVTVAYVDKPYSVTYHEIDIDLVPDVMTWSFKSNATWLHFDTKNLTLYGTPRITDIGIYDVNITVSDGIGGWDTHLFKLRVLRYNISLKFTSDPITTARVDRIYIYQAQVYYKGPKDILVYSLYNYPIGMSVNSSTGLVSWTPNNHQVETHHVLLRVTDGKVTVDQSYYITVRGKPPTTGVTSNIFLIILLILILALTASVIIWEYLRSDRKRPQATSKSKTTPSKPEQIRRSTRPKDPGNRIQR